jgi:hypothetical protein
MTATIHKLSTSSNSFFRARKVRGDYVVQLVTPCVGKELTTSLASFGGEDAAISYGLERAAAIRRPFKVGRASR